MTTAPTTVAVFNCGSSSLSYKVYEIDAAAAAASFVVVASGKAHRVGTASTEAPFLEHRNARTGATCTDERKTLPGHAEAARIVLGWLSTQGVSPQLCGHRFVHGGAHFAASALVTPAVRTLLGACTRLAPIHNAAALAVLDVCAAELRGGRQYVAFDTAFHAEMPAAARTYALPVALAAERGFRKYGFHGLSYAFVVEALRARSLLRPRVVAAHLGTGGASVAGLRDGKTVDTSMGWSPLPGLVMSTRCGDVDASVALELVEPGVRSAEDVLALLNTKSGLVGLTDGLTSDLRDVHKVAHTPGHAHAAQCQLAYDVYLHRLVAHIGSLVALLGGVDTLVFTDDLGFNMPQLRSDVCARFAWLGLQLDEAVNVATTKGHGVLAENDTAVISTPGSAVTVVVVVNDEELVIAREAAQFIASSS